MSIRHHRHLPTPAVAFLCLVFCAAVLAMLLTAAVELWVIVPLRLIQHATEVHP